MASALRGCMALALQLKSVPDAFVQRLPVALLLCGALRLESDALNTENTAAGNLS